MPVDEDPPALELVEPSDQLAERRLARAGVADQRDGLPGLDRQVEVLEDPLLLGVAESDVAELDPALEPADRSRVPLDDPRQGVDQREHPLRGRETLLELRPERGDRGEREPEQHHALQEEVPVARGDLAVDRLRSADVDEQHGGQPGDGEEDREDRAEHEALPQCHRVVLPVDGPELVVDRRFLAEVLRHRDATHRLLDGGVHLREGPLGATGRVTSDAAERQCREDHDRTNGEDDQRKERVPEEQQHHDEADQQHLATRLTVKVTTFAKSSVSEVTRLTTLPEGFSS